MTDLSPEDSIELGPLGRTSDLPDLVPDFSYRADPHSEHDVHKSNERYLGPRRISAHTVAHYAFPISVLLMGGLLYWGLSCLKKSYNASSATTGNNIVSPAQTTAPAP